MNRDSISKFKHRLGQIELRPGRMRLHVGVEELERRELPASGLSTIALVPMSRFDSNGGGRAVIDIDPAAIRLVRGRVLLGFEWQGSAESGAAPAQISVVARRNGERAAMVARMGDASSSNSGR